MPDESDETNKKTLSQTVEIPISPLMIRFFANNYIALRAHVLAFLEKNYPGWDYEEINVKSIPHQKITWKNGEPFYLMVIFKNATD